VRSLFVDFAPPLVPTRGKSTPSVSYALGRHQKSAENFQIDEFAGQRATSASG
jgi:hypothetical protein